MNNYKLTIQYDGGRYKGWQRLGSGENTIQDKIEKVISALIGTDTEIIGCSRTDAGVHALGQVANFKTNLNLAVEEVKNYLNQYLPQDISIIKVEMETEQFHSRYHAKNKTYLYKIWNREYSNPFMRKYSLHIDKTLDIEKMQIASKYFLGAHDFTTFSNAKSKKKSMVREIYEITFDKDHQGFLNIRIRGDGFLYNMVRKMVGVFVQVGLGELDPSKIPEMIETKERNQLIYLADACGLYLEKIDY